MADTERALFLSSLDGPLPEGYSRLYFGSEFCPWTFPSAEAIVDAIHSAHRSGWTFTLATPVITEPFLPRLRETLSQTLPLLREGDELLVSDWGGISAAKGLVSEVPVILGRALSEQKRGPRILDLDLPEEQLDYFRKGGWYSGEACAILSEHAIDRVELDNLLQGIAPLPEGLRGSLHYPYAMVTSSRNCPCRETNPSDGCPLLCNNVFTLKSPQTSMPLLQRGNTQFISNPNLPDSLLSLGIDRLVFHPDLPR